EDGPGPNPERLQFDLAKNSKSPWNSAVLGILCQQLKDQCTTEQWPMQRPDTYIRRLLTEWYKRLRTTWRNAQPKLTEKGTVETPAETEARLVAERQVVLKQCRQTTRCRILDHIVKLKTEGNEDNTGAWKWLQRLVKTLGEHGMSSDESDIGNDVEEVLRVKNMGWRRSIARELDLVDLQWLVDTDIF
ncbi:hypothetical protein EDD17DRAFT_1435622, partial [Pisolithus thermaeus]